jgi:hypothetical protein
MSKIKYPEFLKHCLNITFYHLDDGIKEYLKRWYCYNNTKTCELTDVSIKKIEKFIPDLNSANMWAAVGFNAARIVDAEKSNLGIISCGSMAIFASYVALVYYRRGYKNKWFDETITKEDFLVQCYPLRGSYRISF